jgi:predicted alpha/beta hydrolase
MYGAFAKFLADRGFLVVTYNYRGVGQMARDPNYRFLRMRDWMEDDAGAVIETVRRRFPDHSISAIGHSVGGHAIGIGSSSYYLNSAVVIASHAGSTRFMKSRWERSRTRFLLHAVGPALCRVFGYLPAKALGLGEDIPRGVLTEWRDWTKLPHYFFDDPSLGAAERFARYRGPLLCYGFDDDPWATPPAIDELLKHFVNAQIERRQIDPATDGRGRVGHFGFFRERNADLWHEIADWLDAKSGPPGCGIRPGLSACPCAGLG